MLDGYGYLVPRREGFATLGVVNEGRVMRDGRPAPLVTPPSLAPATHR